MSTARRATTGDFEVKPDTGSVHSSAQKKSAMSPDYFGSITIDTKNAVGLEWDGDILTVKFNGWKKVSKSGKTWLSLAVNRFVPGQDSGQPQNRSRQSRQDDDDIPF